MVLPYSGDSMPLSPRRQGFTLIEMSMVLLIIGLIIGGILGGQEMVNAARIQRTGKEAYEIRDAVSVFVDKYGALPGDMQNATQLWGNSGCTNSDTMNPCDGDGDGRLRSNKSAVNLGDTRFVGEMVHFWQHLNLAQMFPGQYSGLIGSPDFFIPGSNVPAAPLDGTYFLVGWRTQFVTQDGSGNWVRGQYSAIQNMIQLNGTSGLSSIDAKTIDTKLDDGIAYSGRIVGVAGGAGLACPSYNDLNPPDYNTSIKTKDCNVRFNVLDTQRGAI